MHHDLDQAEKEDDKASTGGVSSLDFNFINDFENNADALETIEPANEITSKLLRLLWKRTGICRRAALRAILKTTNKDSSWNHRGEEE